MQISLLEIQVLIIQISELTLDVSLLHIEIVIPGICIQRGSPVIDNVNKN